jgi:DNA-binding transcriptional LysR family regulator
MPIRLPPLSGLRLFEAAARCGSFKRAAYELGLTPGAFTHGIDALEQVLDVRLFERHARGVILTAAGRQYLPYITEALSAIATGTLRLPGRRLDNRLSISSTPLFASKLLLPRLQKFREIHPELVVTVNASPQPIQFPSDQFDLAIGYSRNTWSNLSCDLLGRSRFIPVGAPDYIAGLSRDGGLEWARATLIHLTSVDDDWETWCNHTQSDTSSARKFIVNSSELARQAALDGLGIAIACLPLMEDDIAAGRLAIAVDHVVPVLSGHWLVQPDGTETRRETVAFRNWLLEETSQLSWHPCREPAAPAEPA